MLLLLTEDNFFHFGHRWFNRLQEDFIRADLDVTELLVTEFLCNIGGNYISHVMRYNLPSEFLYSHR